MAKKEYTKSWTGADGKDKEARVWIDEKGEQGRSGGRGDGKPRLCWEIQVTPADTSDEEIAILTALGKESVVAKMAGTRRASSGGSGGSCPAETDEEIAKGIETLTKRLQG